jgi:magnesium chelatase subunit H
MLKRTSGLKPMGTKAGAGDRANRLAMDAAGAVPIRVVLVTLDTHVAGAAMRAQRSLRSELPGLTFTVHAASAWGDAGQTGAGADDAQREALAACRADILQADIVIATMLFMEDHYLPLLDVLTARRDQCDAMVCAMSAGEVMRLTRMGRFAMQGKGGPMALLKRLRGWVRGKPSGNGGEASPHPTSRPSAAQAPKSAPMGGAAQMAMLRRVPQILRFIPGTAQDVRVYFMVLQYWLAGSDENIANLLRLLVQRYADGPRVALRERVSAEPPKAYPEVGVYHPVLAERITQDASRLVQAHAAVADAKGCVGVLLMRSYLLAGNTLHYDGVIAALEARGLTVIAAFASGLDARPAIEGYFLDAQGRPRVDAVLSLTGFSLVGGPAYNDADAAQTILAKLDVPYVAAMPVEFQSLEQWRDSSRGLLPVEATMMVAIPELDGATGSMVFGGRSERAGDAAHDMVVSSERAAMLGDRMAKWVQLRRKARAQRKVAVVLFNFPPNAGAAGTAAFLSVFESLHNLLRALAAKGYDVDVPETVQALRDRVLKGNADRFGSQANVHARVSVADHVAREAHLEAIEAHWGAAPGKHQADGAGIHVLGERFGNVFVGLQPAFGVEGDPMRLLFDGGYAPTHAFSAFYRWMREDFGADALLHFGTHGALEFMPGKQAGLADTCWPDRLVASVPNLYLYASNNPSEGTLAKRRAAATLISHLTPPVTDAGLYRGLSELKGSIDRWRTLSPDEHQTRSQLLPMVQAQAAAVSLADMSPAWTLPQADAQLNQLTLALHELEHTWVPHGLHVLGQPPSAPAQVDLLLAMGESMHGTPPSRDDVVAMVNGQATPDWLHAASPEQRAQWEQLVNARALLAQDHELPALLHALDGGYVRPAPGGDVLRTPEVLPTGRNLHGFDPFRMPSAFAVRDGEQQAERLLARHQADGHAFPESVALVLWGTDNLKSQGAPIAQALALMGAKPRFDSYGRLAGAELVSLETLGRPRVDVMITLSGIFRDLLPLQTKLLAEAAFLAASADEPEARNFVRKHALAYQREHGGDLETAALRVFGNAEGAYGANVNHLIDASTWDSEDELAETYTRRKGFAYSRHGRPSRQTALLQSVLSGVELAYQNLESVELGVTSIDTYFDTLGGISRAVQRAKRQPGDASGLVPAMAPVYIGDQTRGAMGTGTVRTLSEQVAIESHTRMLNPTFFEPLLAHGPEGVRHLEAHVSNTFGWSATTGQVQPWVYQRISETFVLDEAMRDRLATLNPAASARLANRMLEAHRRQYWQADAATLEALERASDELEDRLEGVFVSPVKQAAA